MSIVDVSVIIVSFNTCEMTLNCIRSVYEETQGVTFEVIVIDNASSDRTVDAIKREFPEVRLILNKKNRGFAAANNQGMEIARGRYILLLNSDTIILENAIGRTVEFADTTPAAGVVGCRAFWSDGRQQPNFFRYLRLQTIFIRMFIPGYLMRKSKLLGRDRYIGCNLDRVNEVEVIAGCFMLVRRAVIEKVGVMDEDFFMYGEEAEWCFRIHKAGWSIFYFPGAKIIHYGGQSAELCLKDMSIALARSNLIFLRKTQGWCIAYIANLLMLLSEIPRLCVLPLLLTVPALRRSPSWRSPNFTVHRFRFLFISFIRASWEK